MPVRDRLAEMQKASKYSKDIEKGFEELEMTTPLNQQLSDFDEFMAKAQDLVAEVAKVEQNVAQMNILQKKVFSTPVRSEREKFQAELSDYINQNKQLGRKIQKVVKEEQSKVEKLSGKKGLTSKDLSELHIRKIQIQTHSKRFLEIWTEYNNIQVEYRDKTKKQLVNNIKITGCELTNEQIEEKIDSGDLTGFSSILQETARAKEDLVAIENRHAEMLKLERGIVEIHDMFIEISNLVSQQGEMVTRIEDNVIKAEVDVERGKDDLNKARISQISANKKKICLIGTGIILLLILILVILSEFGAFSSSGGSETRVVEHHYHFNNGSTVVSDEKLPQQVLPPVAVTASTAVTETAVPSSAVTEISVSSATDQTLSTEQSLSESSPAP